jgi:hypothetical protein
MSIVNLSPRPAQARSRWTGRICPPRLALTDLLDERVFDRDGDEPAYPGCRAPEPRQFHLLEAEERRT